jgi:threonine aldolase
VLTAAQVSAAIRSANLHYPTTRLVMLEQTHNQSGGSVLPLESVAAVAAVAHEHGLALHIDGARIFNAAVALGVPVSRVVEGADTVCFCLSKGLACPAGSLLVGPHEYIERARKKRKMLGGGLRQVGVLAAPGLVALDTMVDRLAEDHALAKRLAVSLAEIPAVEIDPGAVETNLVFFAVPGRDLHALQEGLRERGVLAIAVGNTHIRMVTHYGVGPADVDRALGALRELLEPARLPIA